jgi:hypothetical protein
MKQFSIYYTLIGLALLLAINRYYSDFTCFKLSVFALLYPVPFLLLGLFIGRTKSKLLVAFLAIIITDIIAFAILHHFFDIT